MEEGERTRREGKERGKGGGRPPPPPPPPPDNIPSPIGSCSVLNHVQKENDLFIERLRSPFGPFFLAFPLSFSFWFFLLPFPLGRMGASHPSQDGEEERRNIPGQRLRVILLGNSGFVDLKEISDRMFLM